MPTNPSLPFRLILASGSHGRRWLMEQAEYPFEVKPANIDEPTEARLGDCRHYVGELAWLKATKSRKVAAMRMYVIGGPGSGKTSLAVALGDRLSVPVVHLDRSLE